MNRLHIIYLNLLLILQHLTEQVSCVQILVLLLLTPLLPRIL